MPAAAPATAPLRESLVRPKNLLKYSPGVPVREAPSSKTFDPRKPQEPKRLASCKLIYVSQDNHNIGDIGEKMEKTIYIYIEVTG